jgi:abortive infection bacteriophage resistance protein
VIEAWDFGTRSKYFEMLNGTHQNNICKRLNILNPKNLKNWLREINTLRNRCAHHARIWNRSHNPLKITGEQDVNLVNLDEKARTRIYGLIVIIWFLTKKIGPSSDWINNVANLMDEKSKLPRCSYVAMGFPDEYGFPRKLFELSNKNIVTHLEFSEKYRFYSLVNQYINKNNLTKKCLFSVLATVLRKFSK